MKNVFVKSNTLLLSPFASDRVSQQRFLLGPLIEPILVCIAAFVLVSCGPSAAARQPYQQRAREIADRLGRSASNQVAEFETCWDMRNECGHIVAFTTQNSIETIETALSKLGLAAKANTAITSGFTTLGNLASEATTRDRLKKIGPNSLSSKIRPEVYAWLPTDKDGTSISIYLYTVASWPNRYTFDNKPLSDDLVEVLIRYP